MKQLEQLTLETMRRYYDTGTGVRDTAVAMRVSISTVSKYFAVFRTQEKQ